MQLSHQLPCRVSRAVFAVLMAWIWCGGADWAVAEDQPARAPVNRQELAARLDKAFGAIEAAARDVPRDTFDLSATAAGIGAEPAAALTWVRERTAWTPYRGSLRGPVGVLMDRCGNSLDRSMLLAELLRLKGKTVRLAHGQLSDDAAKQVLAATRLDPEKPLPTPVTTRRGDVEMLAKKYVEPAGLDAAEFRRYAEHGLGKSEKLTEDIIQRTTAQTAKLAELVWPAGAAPAEAVSPDTLAALAEHWWVQYQDGERWVDLDSSAVADEVRPKATEFIAWQPKDGQWPLAGSLCHEIDLRLTVEQWDGQKLNEQTVLQETLRPSELIGQYIDVSYIAMNWPSEFSLDKESDPAAALKRAARDQNEWLPVLRIGQRRLHQGSFNDAGVVNPAPNLAALGKHGKATGGAAGKMGGLIGGIGAPPPAAPKAGSHLTALWIDYHVRSPGLPPRQIRRQVFDVLGPAARAGTPSLPERGPSTAARLDRALMLLGHTEILPLVCQLSPEFLSDLTTSNVLKMRQVLTAIATSDDEATLRQAADKAANLQPVPSQLYHLAVSRKLFHPQASRVVIDRPNLFSLHHFARDDGKRGLLYCLATDVVANEVSVRGGPDAQRARLMAGVLDTNAESLLLDPATRVGNVAELFNDKPEANYWLVIRKAEDAAWQQAKVPPDIRARVDADLSQGYVVVMPRKVATASRQPFGWWRIDPTSGHTLGIGEQGWGSELLEYQIQLAAIGHAFCVAGNAAKLDVEGGKVPSLKTQALCALGTLATALTMNTFTTSILIGYSLGAMTGGLAA